MRRRLLGATDLRVSELGLGCSSISGGVFERDDAAARRLLERAFELGINFFDTADGYGYGRSEELLGEVFRRRHQVGRQACHAEVGIVASRHFIEEDRRLVAPRLDEQSARLVRHARRNKRSTI